MSSYLIPYVDSKKKGGEEDPLFSEFTYGDSGIRGKILKDKVTKGDYLFFHTSIRNKRYITAFYQVEEVLDIKKARTDRTVMLKYKNPHLLSTETSKDEVIVFGHTMKSLVLNTPIEINPRLLKDLGIKYTPSPNQTELAALTSKFRNWFNMENYQVKYLMEKAFSMQEENFLKQKQLSSNEVRQLDEADIEQFIAENPTVLNEGFKLIGRQHQFSDGTRLDLLVKNNKTEQTYIIEVKKDDIGIETIKQIRGYIKRYESEEKINDVKGIIVCKGILPHFEDDVLKQSGQKEILIFQYGWMFSIQPFCNYKNNQPSDGTSINI